MPGCSGRSARLQKGGDPLKAVHEFTIAVTYQKMVPTDDGQGTRSVVDRTVDETVEVRVDFEGLAKKLGARSVPCSKTGKTVEAGGLLSCVARSNKRCSQHLRSFASLARGFLRTRKPALLRGVFFQCK